MRKWLLLLAALVAIAIVVLALRRDPVTPSPAVDVADEEAPSPATPRAARPSLALAAVPVGDAGPTAAPVVSASALAALDRPVLDPAAFREKSMVRGQLERDVQQKLDACADASPGLRRPRRVHVRFGPAQVPQRGQVALEQVEFLPNRLGPPPTAYERCLRTLVGQGFALPVERAGLADTVLTLLIPVEGTGAAEAQPGREPSRPGEP